MSGFHVLSLVFSTLKRQAFFIWPNFLGNLFWNRFWSILFSPKQDEHLKGNWLFTRRRSRFGPGMKYVSDRNAVLRHKRNNQVKKIFVQIVSITFFLPSCSKFKIIVRINHSPPPPSCAPSPGVSVSVCAQTSLQCVISVSNTLLALWSLSLPQSLPKTRFRRKVRSSVLGITLTRLSSLSISCWTL